MVTKMEEETCSARSITQAPLKTITVHKTTGRREPPMRKTKKTMKTTIWVIYCRKAMRMTARTKRKNTFSPNMKVFNRNTKTNCERFQP